MQKNQRLLFEIRSSATDTEEKAAKHLTCAAVAVFEAGKARNRFSNAFYGVN